MKSRWRIIGIVIGSLLALAAVAGGAWLYHVHQGRQRAGEMMKHELWEYARAELDRYLWLHPNDHAARLMLAETLVKDETLKGQQPLDSALDHLRRIPDDSPQAAQARTQEARVEFYILHRPAKAERALRKALAADPDSKDANYTLWKILDMTGRSHTASDAFWRVYHQSEPEQQPSLLREWYMSQFYPATANPQLHQLMGLKVNESLPSDDPEIQRFIHFRQQDPKEPLVHALVARWFFVEGHPKDALAFLEDAADKVSQEASEPMFMVTLIESLIALGQLDRAEAVFKQWPEPHTGYDYLTARAQVLESVKKNYAGAARAYRDAINTGWPGPVDWRTRNRLANCLTKAGDREAAATERAHAKVIEENMKNKYHRRNRQLLADLSKPENLEQIAAFYETLKCDKEAAAWRTCAGRIKKRG